MEISICNCKWLASFWCKLSAVEAIVLGPGVAPCGEGPRLVERRASSFRQHLMLNPFDLSFSRSQSARCHKQRRHVAEIAHLLVLSLPATFCVLVFERSYLANQWSEGQGTASMHIYASTCSSFLSPMQCAG